MLIQVEQCDGGYNVHIITNGNVRAGRVHGHGDTVENLKSVSQEGRAESPAKVAFIVDLACEQTLAGVPGGLAAHPSVTGGGDACPDRVASFVPVMGAQKAAAADEATLYKKLICAPPGLEGDVERVGVSPLFTARSASPSVPPPPAAAPRSPLLAAMRARLDRPGPPPASVCWAGGRVDPTPLLPALSAAVGAPVVNATGVGLPVDAADALLFLVENCAVVVCASPTPAHHGLLWGAMSAGVPVVMAEGNPLGQLWAGWRLPVVRYGGGGGVAGAPSTLTPDLLYWGWWENLLRGVQHGVGSADRVAGAGRPP